jgi:hypothetical protein
MIRALAMLALAATLARAGYDPANIPSLPAATDPVNVSTAQQLIDAVASAQPGQTILLADGDYHLTSTLRVRTDSVMLRGASDDPTKAIVRGRGFGHGDRGEELIKIEAASVGFAYLTIRDVRSNGLKVQSGGNHDILVHNCHFIDICERSIKGPSVEVSRNGVVRYCVFEQVTPITDAIPNLYADGDYIAGMDMMDIDGWHIHDNLFKNIRGKNGGGRGAVFLWQRCTNCVVERNTMLNCDRGIALGNYHESENGNHVTNSICRNNFVASDKYDAAIEVAGVDNVKIYNNSVWKADRTGSRGVRFIAYHTNVDFRNNLVHGRLIFDRGEDGVTQGSNVVDDLAGYFEDASSGDLHLTAQATDALAKGESLSDVTEDWDRETRTGDMDIGADQRDGLTVARALPAVHVWRAPGPAASSWSVLGRRFGANDCMVQSPGPRLLIHRLNSTYLVR